MINVYMKRKSLVAAALVALSVYLITPAQPLFYYDDYDGYDGYLGNFARNYRIT